MGGSKGQMTKAVLAVGFCLALCLASTAAGAVEESERARFLYELEREAAHADMPSTMHASTPSAAMPPHAATRGAPDGWLERAGQPPWSPDGAYGADMTDETAADVFREHVSPIVQDQCINCHVEGGPSGHTRLVFVRSSNPDHVALNRRVFEDFLAGVGDGAGVVLDKIRGVGHGGGVQVAAGGADYDRFARFLALLGGDSASVALTPQTLFDGVAMAPHRKTLRRAALIFAGRVPTQEEYASLGEVGVRAAIRSLMQGPAFHDFLVRSGNDRLLTDREDTVLSNARGAPLVSYVNEWVHRCQVVRANGSFFNESRDQWIRRAQYGARRAPLELIAHVVENDLPYTEILTANYVMANPWSARAYGSSVAFDDPEDVHEFRPVRFDSYYLYDDSRAFFRDNSRCGSYILDAGDLPVAFPHAGILNTMVFLRRYPTTATNRNRARARWTYHHFLGVDIEKSAARTTDAEALVDTDNPTLKNPACTVCHVALDPVAGAFQNYGDIGHYRSNLGGMDALDYFYKNDPIGGEEFVVEAQSIQDRERISVAAEFGAGANAVGFRAADGRSRVGLDEVLVRDERGVLTGRYRRGRDRGAGDPDGCGRPDFSHHLVIDGSCVLMIDVDVPRAGRYRVEADVWDEREWDDQPALLKVWTSGEFYREGDTWDRDMRVPGFGDRPAPDADNSLQWLARAVVSDDRFAEGAVKFWWPAVMGREVAAPPERAGDANFEGQSLRAGAQALEVRRLARAFRRGMRGGPPYNLKDLLVEIVLSRWFRAERMSSDDPIRAVALRGAGGGRLLTGEELAAKTLAVTGVQWGRRKPATTLSGRFTTRRHALSGEYAILYGGIDSDGVTERARDLTAVMVGVAKRHAVEVSCPVVLREFYLLPDDERMLFGGIDLTVSPADAEGAEATRAKLVELYDKLLGVSVRKSSPEVSRAYGFFEEVWTRKRSLRANQDRFIDRLDDSVCEMSTDEYYFDDVPRNALADSDLTDPQHVARTWLVMLAALLMDHRYLHL